MATYFTIEEAYGALREAASLQASAEALRESVQKAATTDRYDVFLSHSSRDADLILGVKRLLERKGMSVYVDWVVDPQLDRTKVTAGTANHLRKRMEQCDSLIYAATTNASNSKWMPWELGYFDGHRGDEHIAIMPFVTRQNDAFAGQEYLGLYAVIQKDSYTDGTQGEFVEVPGRYWMSLKDFGRRSKTWQKYGS